MVDPFVWNRQTLKRRMEQRGKRLLPTQEQVLSAIKAGMTERQAADALGLSSHTVHSHVIAVYKRMGVKSRAQLLNIWIGGQK
jgi:DNA-binding NarL/FixJ family response regulator